MNPLVSRKVKRRLMIAVGFLFAPLFFSAVLIAVNAVNPFGLMFLTSFTIKNGTNEEIFVTPIGARDGAGVRCTLPYSVFKRFEVFGIKKGNFRIPAGSSKELTYDWDDVQFSEILVRRNNEPWRVKATGLHPTFSQYRIPQKSCFVISDLEHLPYASEIHLAALPGNSLWTLTIYFLSFLGLASPFLIFNGLRITP